MQVRHIGAAASAVALKTVAASTVRGRIGMGIGSLVAGLLLAAVALAGRRRVARSARPGLAMIIAALQLGSVLLVAVLPVTVASGRAVPGTFIVAVPACAYAAAAALLATRDRQATWPATGSHRSPDRPHTRPRRLSGMTGRAPAVRSRRR